MKTIRNHEGKFGFFLTCFLALQQCFGSNNHFSFDHHEFEYEEYPETIRTEVICPPGQTPVDKPEGMICMVVPEFPDPRRTTPNDRIVFQEEIGKHILTTTVFEGF